MAINRVILTGRIAKDFELRQLPSGKGVTSFTIAQNNYNGEAEYFDCKAYGKAAENLSLYCVKGSHIGIEGSIHLEKWTTKEGQTRYKLVIWAERIEFLSKKQEQYVPPAYAAPVPDAEGDTDLPF